MPLATSARPVIPAARPATDTTPDTVNCEGCPAVIPEDDAERTGCLDALTLCGDCAADHYSRCRTCAADAAA